MDFGKIGLPTLSFLENLLISKTIVHQKLLKLTWGNPAMTSIKGHCICVSQDALENVCAVLPRTLVHDYVEGHCSAGP